MQPHPQESKVDYKMKDNGATPKIPRPAEAAERVEPMLR